MMAPTYHLLLPHSYHSKASYSVIMPFWYYLTMVAFVVILLKYEMIFTYPGTKQL